ncbi:MAG TPA: 5-deoxy-glucuronate isomerase [Candidatus Limnocylindrales bacterium]|nr:5-deoxy-glucuronate isomerase [Candidatus Limnocylindrales bacterium]
MTSPLLIRAKDQGGAGVFASITAADAGWEHLSMEARRLDAGMTFSGQTGNCESARVILGGSCHLRFSGGEYLHIGRRPNVFSGMPWAVYLPPGVEYEIEAITDGFEMASCSVQAEDEFPARLVTPLDCPVELRGGENASRQINGILPPGFPCQRIVAVEVYTPGGNWSSYPPHKHDVHRVDADGALLEADLEEIYFYKLDRPEGYAYQRVYSADRQLDELVMAQTHDIVLVPEGYHPVVSAHGYTTYYLNFLAGSAQSLANSDDPAYAWVKANWRSLDPRLPIVSLEMEP